MKNIEIAVRRLRVIYYAISWSLVAFVLYSIVAIALNINNERDVFVRSFNNGYESAQVEGDMYKNETLSLLDMYYFPSKQSQERREKVVDNESLTIITKVNSFDVYVKTKGRLVRPPVWKFLNILLVIASFVVFLWWLVVAIRLFVQMGRSIRNKDIFNEKLIRLHRKFAILWVAVAVINRIGHTVDAWLISKYLEGTEWEISIPFPLPVLPIAFAVIFYIIAEILKMGSILQKEQELTI